MTLTTQNVVKCGPCPWASVAKFASKSDHRFLSYRDDMGGTFFYIKTQFRKNAFFKKFCKKKLMTLTTQNLISSFPCPWASVAKFTAKSDHPFLSYSVYKGFWPFGHCDLDLWPLTSKQGESIPVILYTNILWDGCPTLMGTPSKLKIRAGVTDV